MDELIRRGLRGDFGYRTRALEALREQVRSDYAEFNRLLEKMKKAPLGTEEEEKLVRAMSWMKKGIEEYKVLRGISIEGVTCVEINEIEKGLTDNETWIRSMPLNLK
ncbi:MAG: hypothetical protein CVU57_23340 [Deltaproteobacteria bacterium HGW-Deltaproteobacteria-15]|jgi:hypothetical protein|nr:MAG: hypothetical protein CVU57_23340 [Deltaproteobacteria bacterium HGW-Deltaproteobacteria-15]